MYTYPEAVNAFESLANEFMKALAPSKNFRVSVTPSADCTTASVSWDDKNLYNNADIHLPVRPATAKLTQSEFEDWTSYLLHEIGHPAFTDKAVWINAVQAGLGNLVNALEDVRMEKALIASGKVVNAKRVLSRLLDRKMAESRSRGWKPNARKEFAWTIAVLGRAANGYDVDATWLRQQLKPGSTVSTILDWALPELDACQSTRDVLNLAKCIEKALMEPKQAEHTSAGKVDTSKGKAAGEAADEGSATEATEKPTSEARKGAEGPSGDSQGSQGSDSDETPVKSARDLTVRELAPEADDVPISEQQRRQAASIVSILRDVLKRTLPGGTYDTGGRSHAAALRDAAAKSSRQRALLARALRANETEDFEGGRRSGRLDRGALCRAVAGSSNVFGRRQLHEGFDTDVHVLVDASGSMISEGRMQAATETALIVAQAAASVGAAYTVESFSQRGHVLAGPVASRAMPDITRFSRMANDAEGGTPLSPNMARAAYQQAQRAPQKRRVMFIITDGGCNYGPEAVRVIGEYLEQHCGTILAHVSIHTPLRGSFKAEVMVPRGGSITGIGLDHFVKVLQAL